MRAGAGTAVCIFRLCSAVNMGIEEHITALGDIHTVCLDIVARRRLEPHRFQLALHHTGSEQGDYKPDDQRD